MVIVIHFINTSQRGGLSYGNIFQIVLEATDRQ